MTLGRPLSPLQLSEPERAQLSEWTRRPKTAQALALRARIVLLSAEGRSNTDIAGKLQVSLPTAESGGNDFWTSVWTDCSMSRAPARRAN